MDTRRLRDLLTAGDYPVLVVGEYKNISVLDPSTFQLCDRLSLTSATEISSIAYASTPAFLDCSPVVIMGTSDGTTDVYSLKRQRSVGTIRQGGGTGAICLEDRVLALSGSGIYSLQHEHRSTLLRVREVHSSTKSQRSNYLFILTETDPSWNSSEYFGCDSSSVQRVDSTTGSVVQSFTSKTGYRITGLGNICSRGLIMTRQHDPDYYGQYVVLNDLSSGRNIETITTNEATPNSSPLGIDHSIYVPATTSNGICAVQVYDIRRTATIVRTIDFNSQFVGLTSAVFRGDWNDSNVLMAACGRRVVRFRCDGSGVEVSDGFMQGSVRGMLRVKREEEEEEVRSSRPVGVRSVTGPLGRPLSVASAAVRQITSTSPPPPKTQRQPPRQRKRKRTTSTIVFESSLSLQTSVTVKSRGLGGLFGRRSTQMEWIPKTVKLKSDSVLEVWTGSIQSLSLQCEERINLNGALVKSIDEESFTFELVVGPVGRGKTLVWKANNGSDLEDWKRFLAEVGVRDTIDVVTTPLPTLPPITLEPVEMDPIGVCWGGLLYVEEGAVVNGARTVFEEHYVKYRPRGNEFWVYSREAGNPPRGNMPPWAKVKFGRGAKLIDEEVRNPSWRRGTFKPGMYAFALEIEVENGKRITFKAPRKYPYEKITWMLVRHGVIYEGNEARLKRLREAVMEAEARGEIILPGTNRRRQRRRRTNPTPTVPSSLSASTPTGLDSLPTTSPTLSGGEEEVEVEEESQLVRNARERASRVEEEFEREMEEKRREADELEKKLENTRRRLREEEEKTRAETQRREQIAEERRSLLEQKQAMEDAIHSLQDSSQRPKWILDPSMISLTSRVLGRGSFGEVIEGTLSIGMANQPVAVKVMRLTPGVRDEVEKEMELMSTLKHENVVRVYGCWFDDDDDDDGEASGGGTTAQIAMELCDGGDLFDWVKKREDVLSLEDRRLILVQIANGMSFLHSLGVVHRDLKPENCLFSKAGTLKIVDFGLSKHASSIRGTVCGSPAYMQNPQYAQHPDKRKLDVYSFAIIAHEVWTSERAFSDLAAMDPFSFIHVVHSEGRRPEIPLNMPTWLRLLLERCWADDPSDRPLFDEIEAILRSNSVDGGEVTPTSHQTFISESPTAATFAPVVSSAGGGTFDASSDSAFLPSGSLAAVPSALPSAIDSITSSQMPGGSFSQSSVPANTFYPSSPSDNSGQTFVSSNATSPTFAVSSTPTVGSTFVQPGLASERTIQSLLEEANQGSLFPRLQEEGIETLDDLRVLVTEAEMEEILEDLIPKRFPRKRFVMKVRKLLSE